MTTQDINRKLAAILSSDVKGYSRLMGEDEVGTIRTLNADFAKTLPLKDQKVLNNLIDALRKAGLK